MHNVIDHRDNRSTCPTELQMFTLAIESSETAGSVALLEDDRLRNQLRLDPSHRSAKTLAPAIAEILKQVGCSGSAVDLVAVASGPGSFTGLRIGVTSAKAFAFAVDCAVAGVNTLEAIAVQAGMPGSRVWAVIDAQRQQFFVAQYAFDLHGNVRCTIATHLVEQDAWVANLEVGTVVSGPGLDRLSSNLPQGVEAAPREKWQPMADTVGKLGYRDWIAGHRETPISLVPAYFRRTAAEEQWERRNTSRS